MQSKWSGIPPEIQLKYFVLVLLLFVENFYIELKKCRDAIPGYSITLSESAFLGSDLIFELKSELR